ncbi:MAG: hypothetical protein QG608_187 [Actinomycetota bacterium]|nr:hypothetical protein [Actinomycetota bacterium]
MTALPDPDRSRALLIGVADYAGFPALPAAQNNLRSLRGLLTNPTSGWLASRRCRTVPDAKAPADVFPLVKELANQAEDTFLLYFAGHGCIGSGNELHLCLGATAPEELWYTSLPYQQVRQALLGARACRRIVILDCCYSGRAITTMGSRAQAIAGGLPIEGTYVLTATGATEEAFAPRGQEHTTFSKALIEILDEGLPDAPELLTCSTLFRELDRRLVGQGAPRPHQQGHDTVTDLALARNRAHRPGPAPQAGDPLVPASLPASLRTGLDSPHPQIRIGTVRELASWLHGTPAQQATARTELLQIAARDIAQVAEIAHQALRGSPVLGVPPATVTVLPGPLLSEEHDSPESGVRSSVSNFWDESAETGKGPSPVEPRHSSGPGTAEHRGFWAGAALWTWDALWLLPAVLGAGLLNWVGFLIIGLRARRDRWLLLAGISFAIMLALVCLPPEEELNGAWGFAFIGNWLLLLAISVYEHRNWRHFQKDRRSRQRSRRSRRSRRQSHRS